MTQDGVSRREFLTKAAVGTLALAAMGDWSFAAPRNKKPLNVLFVTADDLDRNSLGCFGGKVKGLTPNLDKFASEGMRFERAHVNVAICMPSRIVLGTGLYGHNSGAMGFMHARPDVPSVIGLFQKAGYHLGVMGKVPHSSPRVEDKWDYQVARSELGDGRNPEIYYQKCKDFFDQCKETKKPFYFMVNSHDPHRPFQRPRGLSRGAVMPSRLHKSEDVPVPGFLPDLPGVRQELSYYLNSVRRLDDTFGKVMQALKESGFEDNTLVMFISDNGIAVPFAKCNCYLASTRTPWLVRWPGVVKPDSVDETHFISGVDYLPTVLEATGLPKLLRQDGKSFIPLLKGKTQAGRESVFTQIDSKAGNGYVPMRCVQNGKFGYIFNAWSSGKARYRNNNEGLCMKSMEEAAKTNPEIAARVKVFRYRTLEEFYDMENDPDCLNNLMDDPGYKQQREEFISKMDQWMVKTNDSLLEAFRNRYDKIGLRKGLRIARRAQSGIRPIRRKR